MSAEGKNPEEGVPVSEASPYPLDVMRLSKGDLIAPEECERMAGVKRTHPRYSLRLCAVIQQIERMWVEERGEVVTARQDHDGIRICDDNSAVVVNKRTFVVGVRKIVKANRRVNGVDREKLSPPMMVEQERVACTTAAFISGGRKAVRVALKPHHDERPPLFEEEKSKE